MKTIILTILTTLLLTACERGPQDDVSIVILNKQLAKAMQQYQASYKKRRTELEFENGERVTTCAEYLTANKASLIKEGVNNQIIKNEYLECDVLSLLGDSSFTREKQKVSTGEALATRLDLRTFPSSLFRRVDDNAYTLKQVAGKQTSSTQHTVVYETDDWFYRLEVVAQADLNKNGEPDWIVWLFDEAKTGNYRSYQTLIIYDPAKQDKLKAVRVL